MPRAKKQATAPSPPVLSLQDLRIAFVRLTAAGLDGLSQADLQNEVTKNGGTIVTQIDKCTHFIATKEQYDKSLVRVKEAVANSDVNIVTIEWLKDSFSANGKVDESKYLLHTRNANAQKAPAANANSGTKRSRSASNDKDDDDDIKPAANKKAKAEDDEAEAKKQPSTMNIPLDEGLIMSNTTDYKVVIDDDGTIYDVTLNQTNAGNNNNKFYRIQLLVDSKGKNWCWTRWGRVGERGQMKMLGDGTFDFALKELTKKFKDKNGNSWDNRLGPTKSGKYTFIEKSYEDSDDEDAGSPSKKKGGSKVKTEDGDDDEGEEVASKLPEAVQRLMKLIFNQDYMNSTLASLDYDVNKMPLGKLSKSTLLRGYTVLKNLTAVMGGGQVGNITDLSNQYFSLIPHAFGRNHPPVLNQMPMIKKEIELLESLTDMQLANDIMKNAKTKQGSKDAVNMLDRQFEGLSLQEMTPLDPKSTEFKELQNYLVKSGAPTHNLQYQVEDIFRIERKGEFERFDKSDFSGISNKNRRLLWHGSRCTNFGGILSQGLRIAPPEAPVNGYMFGKGVYLADMSSKSANYCCSYNSGGIGLLLLCEAELGNPPLKLTNANSNAAAVAKAQGAISTWGVGSHAPLLWKDAGAVHKSLKGVQMPDVVKQAPSDTNEPGAYLQYNEFIAYDVAQVKLRYLLRCKID